MSSRRTVRRHIHFLAPVTRRSMVVDPCLDGSRYELLVTLLSECPDCVPDPEAGFPPCDYCGTFHCACCGETLSNMLAVQHGERVIRCVLCGSGGFLAGRCEHVGVKAGSAPRCATSGA